MRLTSPASRNREISMFEPFRRQFEDIMSDFGRWPAMDWPSKDGLAALDVAVEGQALVISGEKKSESENQDKAWRVIERSYGAFHRVVPLTFAPDPEKITAAFDKGALRVKVAKPAERVAKKVTIPVIEAN